MKPRLWLFLLPVCAALFPLAAQAQGAEAWAVFEYRLLLREQQEKAPRLSLRLNSDTRFAQLTEGIDLMFLRVGPLVDVKPWLVLGASLTAVSDKLGNGLQSSEYRVELEPTFQGRAGNFTWSDRNRGEFRFGDKQRLRYRNLLRVNYAPQGAHWMPFVWNEALIEADLEVEKGADEGFNQNRLSAGVGYLLRDATRLDVGYIRRSKTVAGEWLGDNVLWVSLFIGIPPKAKAPEPPPLPPIPDSDPTTEPASAPTSAPASAPVELPPSGY
jgi:hypothetical protein